MLDMGWTDSVELAIWCPGDWQILQHGPVQHQHLLLKGTRGAANHAVAALHIIKL
jgi:hypothetical protein